MQEILFFYFVLPYIFLLKNISKHTYFAAASLIEVDKMQVKFAGYGVGEGRSSGVMSVRRTVLSAF